MCVGEWLCEEGQCVWACQIEDELDAEYEIDVCDTQEDPGLLIRDGPESIIMEHTFDESCCGEITLEAEKDGNSIRINEICEGGLCKHSICININAEIEVAPGNYKIRVYGLDYDGAEGPKVGESVVRVGKTEGRYLFVEHIRETEGRLIAGDYIYTALGSSEYVFDPDERVVLTLNDVNTDGLEMIYGVEETLSGDAGEGTERRLYEVRSVPKVAGEDRITRFWDDGRVAVDYGTNTITLDVGEEWSEAREEDDVGDYKTGLVRLITTDTIINHGFVEYKSGGIK
jgi:hypothetical protein